MLLFGFNSSFLILTYYFFSSPPSLFILPFQASTSPSAVILLSELTGVSREDLKPYCVSLATASRTFYLALKSDEELYGWMDEIYSRSPLMGVSNPTNFVHQVHVGFDPISGAFTGLPEQWTRLLTSSAITKEDYAKNPQAVLDVLEFYTDIQKRERDDFTSMERPIKSRLSNTPETSQSRELGATSLQSTSLDRSRTPASLSPQQIGYRLPPGPPPREGETYSAKPLPAYESSRQPSLTSSRPVLFPSRAAPPVPSPNLNHNLQSELSPQTGSRPFLSNRLEDSSLSTNSPSAQSIVSSQYQEKGQSVSPSNALNPTKLAHAKNLEKLSETASNGAVGSSDRRVSTMTETQIMMKLRSVCSPQDPNALYSKIKKVGQGASGSVYVAKVLSNGTKVAIKQMDLSHQPRKELIVNEILVMKESQHPNIVNFLDSFLVKSAELWVVMEYMEGGALTDVIDSNSLEEDQIASISNEVSFTSCTFSFLTLSPS